MDKLESIGSVYTLQFISVNCHKPCYFLHPAKKLKTFLKNHVQWIDYLQCYKQNWQGIVAIKLLRLFCWLKKNDFLHVWMTLIKTWMYLKTLYRRLTLTISNHQVLNKQWIYSFIVLLLISHFLHPWKVD